MLSGTIAWLVGTFLLRFLPILPNGLGVFLLPIALYCAWRLPRIRLVCVLLSGFLWANAYQSWIYSHLIPAELEGEDLLVEGRIVALPTRTGGAYRFDFALSQVLINNRSIAWRGKIRLRCYQCSHTLLPGAHWRFMVRLKRPRGFKNPHGFDYENWLLSQHVVATGYIKQSSNNEFIEPASWQQGIQRLRYRLQQRLRNALAEYPYAGLVEALALGVRDAIPAEQLHQLRATGTIHLVVISGLHVGLVAGVTYWLGVGVVRWFTPLTTWLAAPRIAAIFSLLVSTLYALLAGFGVPTQRAWVMVACTMGAVISGRSIAPWHILAVAALVVLIINPLSVYSNGFWMSFAAVGLIFWAVAGRCATPRSYWRSALKVQWWITLGLVPLQLFLFQQISSVAFVVNLVAVPVLSFVAVPCVLITSLLLLLDERVGAWCIPLAHAAVQLLWLPIEFGAGFTFANLPFSAVAGIWLVPALVGVVWLLAPAGVPHRSLALLLVAPLFILEPQRLPDGDFRFTLLDVGQGLSAVIQTRTHVLVYDTGPKFSTHFDAGQAVLVPFLRRLGVQEIDTLIISHADSDHVGGAASVLRGVAVQQVLASQSLPFLQVNVTMCRMGQAWQWDGVAFEILYPDLDHGLSENNRSCVLRISGAGGKVLLTGDIEKRAEQRLLTRYGDQLKADIVTVPHHGSATSSTAAFVNALAPDFALIGVGYRNRFGFPKPQVLMRYQAHDVCVLDTAQHGAVIFQVRAGSGISQPWVARRGTQRCVDAPARLD